MKLVLVLLSSLFINLNGLSLDEIGLKYGTDKSSQGHDYTKIYEKYFKEFRTQPIRFLEIGFGWEGKSACMWEEYFENARLYFIDINQKGLTKARTLERSTLHILDQANRTALSNFIAVNGGDFDIIIDDGGHTMQQQLISFQTLWPHLKSGGIYVIEDLHTSYSYIPYYSKMFGCGNPSQTMVSYLQELVHSVNRIGARSGCAHFDNCPTDIKETLNDYDKEIESIHFYCSLCFIFKR